MALIKHLLITGAFVACALFASAPSGSLAQNASAAVERVTMIAALFDRIEAVSERAIDPPVDIREIRDMEAAEWQKSELVIRNYYTTLANELDELEAIIGRVREPPKDLEPVRLARDRAQIKLLAYHLSSGRVFASIYLDLIAATRAQDKLAFRASAVDLQDALIQKEEVTLAYLSSLSKSASPYAQARRNVEKTDSERFILELKAGRALILGDPVLDLTHAYSRTIDRLDQNTAALVSAKPTLERLLESLVDDEEKGQELLAQAGQFAAKWQELTPLLRQLWELRYPRSGRPSQRKDPAFQDLQSRASQLEQDIHMLNDDFKSKIRQTALGTQLN
ncbi:MAG: hypothetical protein AAGC81_14600 [Pseudomonadota bacterium]